MQRVDAIAAVLARHLQVAARQGAEGVVATHAAEYGRVCACSPIDHIVTSISLKLVVQARSGDDVGTAGADEEAGARRRIDAQFAAQAVVAVQPHEGGDVVLAVSRVRSADLGIGHQRVRRVVLRCRQRDAVLERMLQAECVAQFVQQRFIALAALVQVRVLEIPFDVVEVDVGVGVIASQLHTFVAIAAVPAAQARHIARDEIDVGKMDLCGIAVGRLGELDARQLRDVGQGGTGRILLGRRKRLLGAREILCRGRRILGAGGDGKRVLERIDRIAGGIRLEVPVGTAIEQGIDIVQPGQGSGRDVGYGSH